MQPFSVSVDTDLAPIEAWARVTDWHRHGEVVPLTSVRVFGDGRSAVGTVFTARTAVGRAGFDDPMEIVEWTPPDDVGAGAGHCRLEKRGRVMAGWAEITVGRTSSGSRVTWREAAKPAKLPAFTDPVSKFAGKLLFGRALRKLLAD